MGRIAAVRIEVAAHLASTVKKQSRKSVVEVSAYTGKLSLLGHAHLSPWMREPIYEHVCMGGIFTCLPLYPSR